MASQIRHVATDPADAPGRSYIGEELVEDLDDPIGVFRPPEQSMHHDDVVQVGTSSAQDRLTVPQ